MLISFCFCGTACNDKASVNVYAPDGAPALSLTSFIDKNFESVNVSIIDSKKIGATITGKNPKADVCILPINMASTLIGDGKNYKMLGTITHGNFYFLSSKLGSINSLNVEDLKGKTIGVIQLKNVPGLTLKYSLKNKNIDYKEISSLSEKDENKVNLLAISNLELVNNEIDVFLVPSPLADIKDSTTSLKIVGSLQEIYGENGFPQAIVVAKNSLIKNDLKFVKSFVLEVKNSNEFLKNTQKEKICSLVLSRLESGLTPTFNKNNLTDNCILHSNIKFVSAKENKEEVLGFIQSLKEIEPNSANVFSQDFFYLGDLWK